MCFFVSGEQQAAEQLFFFFEDLGGTYKGWLVRFKAG